MVPEYFRIYGQLWSPTDVFEWVKTFVSWAEAPVHRYYRDWFEGSGHFGELGPDEELVEDWIAMAERENSTLLQGRTGHESGPGSQDREIFADRRQNTGICRW